MKKSFLAVIFLVLVQVTFAQYDPKALEILEAMGEKYKSMPSYEANFSYALTNDVENIKEEFKGKLTVKGDKYRISLPEQEVINNGVTVWTYLPEVKEVNIDNYDKNSGDINPLKIYEIYQKDFKYLYIQEKTEDGVVVEEVDLVPEKKDAQYFKIKLLIKKKDKVIQSLTMFDKGGNRYKYTITKFVPNAQVADSYFAFDPKKHPDVDVIDLR
ncbi:MAG TPA: outer membrane lipoprotein carrier protein LolA, partial [Chryseosolibacter sp.]|nr:outer membrane lipoprotein carrier protein LolA [Chryseosolibacter sp.]